MGSHLTVHATDALIMAQSETNPVLLDGPNITNQIMLPPSNIEPIGGPIVGPVTEDPIVQDEYQVPIENYYGDPMNTQRVTDDINQGPVNVSDYDHNGVNLALDLPGDTNSDQVAAAINQDETTSNYVRRQAAAAGKYVYDQAAAVGNYAGKLVTNVATDLASNALMGVGIAAVPAQRTAKFAVDTAGNYAYDQTKAAINYAGQYAQDPAKVVTNIATDAVKGMAINALTGGGIAAVPVQYAVDLAGYAVDLAGDYLYDKAIDCVYEGKCPHNSNQSYWDQGKELVNETWNNLNIPKMAGESVVNTIASTAGESVVNTIASTLAPGMLF